MPGLYRAIRDDLLAVFDASWSHPSVPVFWRADDLEPRPDPSDVANFLRNSVLFGPEKLTGFGGGRTANLMSQFGSVEFIVFASRESVSEDVLLDLLSDAMGTMRSKRVVGSYATGSDLSFLDNGSGFDIGPSEDGGWFMRGARMTFEYRFIG
jgi:hypothetical protein